MPYIYIYIYIDIYYIDMSVLPKNRQLLFSIRSYIRDTSEDIADVNSFVFRLFFNVRNTHIYVIKRKLHVALTREIFFPLGDSLHMFI